jgi:hypothetical protein
VGQLTLDPKLLDGSLVAGSQKVFGIGNYGGVFASRRNNTTTTTPITFAFENTEVGAADVPNRAPVIADLADRGDEQGQPVRVAVSATDPDGDTPLTYSATGLPDGITIDPATGVVSGAATRSSQEPAEVVVRVTDPEGLEDTETFTWLITAPYAPVVDSLKVNFTKRTGATAIAGHRNDAGQPFGDKDTGLRYGWVGVNAAGSAVTHEPLDLSVGGSAGQGNGRERDLLDDQLRDSLMHLQGDDVQAFEQAKSPPGTFNGTAREGAWELAVADGLYDVTVGAGDPSAFTEGASVPERHVLNVEGVKAWATPFEPGTLTGVNRTKVATVEDVRVTDGRLTLDAIGGHNTKALFIEVTRNVNTAPTLEAVADRANKTGDAVNLAVTGADTDGDALVYSATGLPAGLSIDSATGTISGTIAPAAARTEPYAVTVTVTDDGTPARTASRSFAWTVGEGDAPVRPGTRVNLGGPAVTVGTTTWQSCTSSAACGIRHVRGVGSPFATTATITGAQAPANAALYQTGFAGPTVAAAGTRTVAFVGFVPNGRYTVRLHFAETRAQSSTFTVDVNKGADELVDFTPATAAGGVNRATFVDVAVNLTDGKLDVDLFHGSGPAFLNAIELLPEQAVDTTPPGAVTGLAATALDKRIDVRWTNPSASDFTGVKVFRSTSGPADSAAGGTGQTLVYQGNGTGHSSTGLTNGTRYHFTVFALDAAGNASPRATLSEVPAATPDPVAVRPTVRVNMADVARTTGGVDWAACTSAAACGDGVITGGFAYGNPNAATSNPVAPADAAIYRREWTGGATEGKAAGTRAFGWSRDLPNGRYLVRLHFADHNQRAIGKRVFDVDIEGGADELPLFDVFKEAGGFDRAIVREHTVDLTDGRLDVDFITRVENALVNAIEVIPVAEPAAPATATATATRSASVAPSEDTTREAAPAAPREASVTGTADSSSPASSPATAPVAEPVAEPVRVDAGGAGAKVADATFAACSALKACSRLVVGGRGVEYAPLGARSAPSGAKGRLYRTVWTGGRDLKAGATAFRFDVPVRNGRHTVKLHFAEPTVAAAGLRLFDVAIEGGRPELRRFDVFRAAGGRGRPVVRSFTVRVTDGKATIRFVKRVGEPIVSAVEVVPAGR